MFAGKALRCDCGHVVRARDEDGLAEAIRRHAWEKHRIDFSDELAHELARSAAPVPGGRENRTEEETMRIAASVLRIEGRG
jgi:predicted small metal-binding protein